MSTHSQRFGNLLFVLALVGAPLSTGCFCGGDNWTRYADDRAALTIGAGTPALAPLTISAPTSTSSDPIVVEVGVNDCNAGSFTLGARVLRADGTALTVASAFSNTTDQVTCPTRSAQFALEASDLTCGTDGRCRADLQVELTSDTGVGPREIEARLVYRGIGACEQNVRRDGAIDAFGN